MKYRKKPVEVEAIQLTRSNIKEVLVFIGYLSSVDWQPTSTIESMKYDDYISLIQQKGLTIHTLEGDMLASIGDYIIKGIQGEFYPCKPDIFLRTYEKAQKELPQWAKELATETPSEMRKMK